MSIESQSEPPPRTLPAMDQEARKIGAAIEHIQAHGNLDGFPARRSERLALVATAARQGLVTWNRSRGRYDLTSRGHWRVRALRRAGRNALRERQVGAIRSGMNAVVAAAASVVVVGAAFLAFNPFGAAKVGPAPAAEAYFANRTAGSARAEMPKGAQLETAERRDVRPTAMTDRMQKSVEQVSTAALGARDELGDPKASIRPGEPARSLAALMPSAPEIGSVARTKTAAEDRGERPEATKPAAKSKRTARRHETVRSGYAYAPPSAYSYGPYGGAQNYRYGSGSPWSFR
jgi:hypothetical protein